MTSNEFASLEAVHFALLQSLEDNFTLAVIMFVVGFIATCTIIIFIVVMHRSVHQSGDDSGEQGSMSEGTLREGDE